MSQFWSQFLGVVTGSFITLLGIWLTNYLSERKIKNIRKGEILEALSSTLTKAVTQISFFQIIEDEKNYCSAVLNLSHTNNAFKESTDFKLMQNEFPRWIGLLVSNAEKIVELRGELIRLHMSYKIFFGKDDKLNSLMDELVKPAELNFQKYTNITDIPKLMEIHESNGNLIANHLKNNTEAKRKAVIDYLDEKLSDLD